MAKLTGSTESSAAPSTSAYDRKLQLITENLSKRYGAAVALQPTSLGVGKGEFLTLLGPSGSGKTTLLKLLSGLVSPNSGRVLIDGKDQTDMPAHKRGIGLVFQNYALFPHLTVEENIRFPLEMRGASEAQIASEVEKVVNMVHLQAFTDRFPQQLSGGQQQRVALARCFVYKPSIILMDEPLGALDKKLREHMQFEIKRLHRETGATIIYVTHDQEEALCLSDRICLMNNGAIEQLASPRTLYESPASEFAADFIGISNILRGKVSDDRFQLLHPSGPLRLPSRQDVAGTSIGLVIRPENLMLTGDDTMNVISGEVIDVAYFGCEARVMVRIPGDKEVIVRISACEACPPAGSSVKVYWRHEMATVVK